METQFRLDLKVAGRWIPATTELMSESKAETLKRAYAYQRPHVETRVVPVNGNGKKSKRARR